MDGRIGPDPPVRASLPAPIRPSPATRDPLRDPLHRPDAPTAGRRGKRSGQGVADQPAVLAFQDADPGLMIHEYEKAAH